MEMMKKISENILRLLDESGTSSTELAKELNITRQTLTNYLKGNTVIDTLKLVQIAEYFNVSINDLIEFEQNRKPAILFRTALIYADSIDHYADRIINYIDRYRVIAKKAGQNITFFPEQYNLQIEIDESLIDINYELDEYTSKYKVNEKLEKEIEIIADEQRRFLGLEEQGAISLISAVTSRGVNVVFLDFEDTDLFGLSVCDNAYGSYIFINDSEQITAERKLFTIAHEYGHLLLHRPLYSRRIEQFMPKNKKKSILDSMADCFAGYLLCPYSIIKKYSSILDSLNNLTQLFPVKHELQVSMSSLMTNLNKHEFINKQTLNPYYAFIRQNNMEKDEISPFTDIEALNSQFLAAKSRQQFLLLRNAFKKGNIDINDVKLIMDIPAQKASEHINKWKEELEMSNMEELKL